MRKLDLTDQAFGNWTAAHAGVRPAYWHCRCACGSEKEVFIGSLRAGTSTGCIKCQARKASESGSAAQRATKHGMFRSSEYSSWRKMKERCYRTNSEHYEDYGARGIAVCDRWRESFENFLQDMGKKPTNRHTIDRIDVNGPYAPGNCRWATMRQQNRNKRNSRWVEVEGQHMRLIDAAAKYGIDYGVAKARVDRGWDVYRALTTPARKLSHTTPPVP